MTSDTHPQFYFIIILKNPTDMALGKDIGHVTFNGLPVVRH